jgi:hypothetical protein
MKRYFLLPISAFGMWIPFYILTNENIVSKLPLGFYMMFWVVWVAVLLVMGVGPMIFYAIKIVDRVQRMAGLDRPLTIPFLMMGLSAIIILVLPLPISDAVKAANGEIDMTCYVAFWLKVIGPFLYLSAIPPGFCLRRIYLSLENFKVHPIDKQANVWYNDFSRKKEV